MVGKEDLMNAIALNSTMFNGARIVGPAVAGILVAMIGEGWCFFANAVSYIAVIVGLMMMRMRRPVQRPPSGSPLTHILEGFRFVAHTRPIRAILLLLGLVSLVGMPYTVLMPIFADRILHGGARGLGILMSATGVGALLGRPDAGRTDPRPRTGPLGGVLVRRVRGRAWSCSRRRAASGFRPRSWCRSGFCMMLQMASSNTLVQTMAPDHLRGRVMAVYSMMFMGMAPFGALIGGALADRLGAPLTVAMGGVTCAAGAVWFGLTLPSIRLEARRLVLAEAAAGGEPSD